MPPVAKKTATVVETPVVVPPVVQEKVEKKVKKVAPKVVEPEPVVAVAPPAPVATKDEVAVVADEENAINSLVEKVASLASLIKEVQASIKPVFKEYERQRKIIERIQKKRDNARNSPSGFAKPNKISNELCDFIGVPHGTEKSRTDITRYINAYVKEHNLNKPTNRRVIIPDDKLKAILKINEGEEVTFFILQRLISHHFPPKKVVG